MSGDDREEDESFVFLDGTDRMGVGPTVLAGESAGKREGFVALVNREAGDAFPQGLLSLSHRHKPQRPVIAGGQRQWSLA